MDFDDGELREGIKRFREYLEPVLGRGNYTNDAITTLYRCLTGMDVSYIPIDELFKGNSAVNSRLTGALIECGIPTVADVISLSEEELSRKAGITEGGVNAVKNGLKPYGLSLRGENKEPWMERGDVRERDIREVFRNPDVVELLKGEKIKTVGDLVETSEGRLRRIKGIGKTKVLYINEILEKLGVKIGEDLSEGFN